MVLGVTNIHGSGASYEQLSGWFRDHLGEHILFYTMVDEGLVEQLFSAYYDNIRNKVFK